MLRLYYYIPERVRFKLKFIRLQKAITKLLGPLYPTNHSIIGIDITYDCNLKCLNCHNSCRQAPSKDYMSIEQIGKFIKESIGQKMKWSNIAILGGEPILHPNIFDIIKLLLSYKEDFSPDTIIQLYTNGFSPEANDVLCKVGNKVSIVNSHKEKIFQSFYAFNIAPMDDIRYKNVDYSNGCATAQNCGLVLNKYGYYMCALGGGIDRVLGFDIGRKKIPSMDDSMLDQRRILCKYCGYFGLSRITTKEEISLSWKHAYENYNKKRPYLLPY